MNEIVAFRGLRFSRARGDDLSAVVAPPYDVISPAQKERLLLRDAHNIVRLELGDDLPGDNASENRYTRASRLLAEWRHDGVLRVDAEPCLYLCEQEFADHYGASRKRSGLVAAVRLRDYSEGIVRPHESTKEAPKLDRLNLLRSTRANLSPIFVLCDDPCDEFDSLLAAETAGSPVAAAVGDDGVVSRLWTIERTDVIRQFQSALAPLPLFIADGHHRYETALNFRHERMDAAVAWSGDEPENFAMMMIVNTRNSGLVIYPTHRMLRVGMLVNWDSVMALLRTCFEVDEVGPSVLSSAMEEAHEQTFGLCARGCGFLLRLVSHDRIRPWLDAGKSSHYNGLDVTILHSIIIDRLLVEAGIPRDEVGIEYTADTIEAISNAQTGESTMTFLLRPTRMEQVLAVASAGEKMPPKSTYFFPKVITGLVMRLVQ